MSKCYLCDRAFDGQDVVDHGEHVIPNAIGGLLIVNGILCEACGNKLGAGVDDRLGDALRALCVVFDIRRDRDKRLIVPVEVTLKSGLVLDPATRTFFVEYGLTPRPKGPTVIRDDVAKIAYISGSTEDQVRQYAHSPAIAALRATGYQVELDPDLEPLIDRVVLRMDWDSIDLARGLIKIAIGYARYHGIARSVLSHLIVNDSDIMNDPTRIRRAVSAYYPTGWGEALYEAERYGTDDFPPNHQLALFSHGSRLYCYVDLFGVIQRYVLLSDAWPVLAVRERYVQRCPKWVYNETDGCPRRIQDLHMLAGEFGINMTGRTWDEISRDVRNAATSRPYALPPHNHLAKPGYMVHHLATMTKAPPPVHTTTATVRRRAGIAETVFGNDINAALGANLLKVQRFVRDWDPNEFRITNEKGFSPDLSAAVGSGRMTAFRDFRLTQFATTYAAPWLIEPR